MEKPSAGLDHGRPVKAAEVWRAARGGGCHRGACRGCPADHRGARFAPVSAGRRSRPGRPGHHQSDGIVRWCRRKSGWCGAHRTLGAGRGRWASGVGFGGRLGRWFGRRDRCRLGRRFRRWFGGRDRCRLRAVAGVGRRLSAWAWPWASQSDAPLVFGVFVGRTVGRGVGGGRRGWHDRRRGRRIRRRGRGARGRPSAVALGAGGESPGTATGEDPSAVGLGGASVPSRTARRPRCAARSRKRGDRDDHQGRVANAPSARHGCATRPRRHDRARGDRVGLAIRAGPGASAMRQCRPRRGASAGHHSWARGTPARRPSSSAASAAARAA